VSCSGSDDEASPQFHLPRSKKAQLTLQLHPLRARSTAGGGKRLVANIHHTSPIHAPIHPSFHPPTGSADWEGDCPAQPAAGWSELLQVISDDDVRGCVDEGTGCG